MADNQYRNLNNEQYWTKRAETRVNDEYKDLKNVEKALAGHYRLAYDDLRQLMSDFYTQYAKDNKITYQEAIKQLNTYELGDYQAKLKRMLPQIKSTNDPFLIAEYQKLMQVAKLNRLQALMNQIDARLLQLGYTQQMDMEGWLMGLYATNYYHTIFDVQVGTGIGYSFALLNEDAIMQAITYAWSGDQFSDRIWTNKTKLVTVLRQTIINGLIKGESVQQMAKDINQQMNRGYKNALRLVRTETAYTIGESTAQGYTNSKVVDQYKIVATLDDRTDSVCRKLDGRVYRLKDRKVGVNASPYHPNCRCTEIPYFGNGEHLDKSMRIARGSDGERYYVPASMSYDEWYKKYVQ